LALATSLLAFASRAASPQSGTATESGAELLLPTGGRAVGMGQAVVAMATGAEAVWWNPALITRTPREAVFHFSQTLATNGDYAASVLFPVPSIAAAFAVTARYIDYGPQESTGRTDPNELGEFTTTSTILGASFAATFGRRFAAGITYKALQYRFPCTGVCLNTPSRSPPTSALDVGAQYVLRKDTSLSVGAAIRNVGLRLQVQDAPQADPLPSRIDIGVVFAPRIPQLPSDAKVRFGADVVSRLTGWGPGYRAGAELSWQNRYQLRAGYVQFGPTGSNGSVGVGYSTRRVQLDFAQLITDAASGTGSPSFFSARWLF
jgi:hypothetical protein